MSTNSELKARLARLGPIRDAAPPPSYSGALVPLVLRLDGPLSHPVSIAQRLRSAGLTLREAHAVINRLAERGLAVTAVPSDAGIPGLAADLTQMDVRVQTRRVFDPGLIAEVRGRRGLSQREFAGLLGLDVDTLRNWEQGRNKPDAITLSLIQIFDQFPDVAERVLFEPAA
jgi:putative transcriptional regulator